MWSQNITLLYNVHNRKWNVIIFFHCLVILDVANTVIVRVCIYYLSYYRVRNVNKPHKYFPFFAY